MKTNTLLKQIRQEHASAFTHGGKFHADDVFSAALLLYLNPEITITRGNKVPEDFEGIVFDIGRGSTIITRKTVGSGRTELRMRHLGFCGKHWERRFWEKNWHRNLMKRLYSH